MQIHVGSKHLIADVAVALDVSGREHLVVAAKSSWQLPKPGQRARPLAPEPMSVSDEFYGEPGASALRYPSDFARFKPRCDVLFDACAHSPAGQPVKEMLASWQVGPLKKSLRAHGPRHWFRTLGVNSLSASQPVVSVPLHFGYAFGGSVPLSKGGAGTGEADVYSPNPVGRGFAGKRTADQIDTMPAAQLEAVDERLRSPYDKLSPQAFSAVPSNFPSRLRFAGTYDEAWAHDVAPFLPDDFSDEFNQCAPSDQQMPYPKGGEQVILEGMLKGVPRLRFQLPDLAPLEVRILRTDYSVEVVSAPADTLFFELEKGRFNAVWRAHAPLRRRIQEIDTVTVGKVDTAWWDARRLGLEQEGGCAGCGDMPPEALLSREIAE